MSDSYEQAVLPLQERAHDTWIERARWAAVSLARRSSGPITIDMVRNVCPPPEGVDPRVMGAVFKPKAVWECVGYTSSKRGVNHGRPVAQWRLKVHRHDQ